MRCAHRPRRRPTAPGGRARHCAALRGALAALQALAPGADLPGVTLLGERAALAGLTRRSPRSPGGATRLLRALDGPVAVTLARDDDHASVPAILAQNRVDDPWESLAAWAATTTAGEVADRCQLLGVAAAAPRDEVPSSPFAVDGGHRRRP